jgi:uncharacterized metal-binding protein YceD (DUF177 family)
MQGGKEYIIQFVGLPVGKHEYEFEVTDKFFDRLEYSEIKRGNVKVDLTLLKQSSMMSLEFKIGGTVKVNCDLCTAEFDLPIAGDYKLIVKVGGSDATDEDDDIITLAANEHEIDLAQYIYEYIILSLPIKRVHPPDKDGNSTCDQEMLEKVQKYLTEEEKDDKTDPRWDGLKNIKLN